MSALTEPAPEPKPAEGSTDYDPSAEFEEIWRAAYKAAVEEGPLDYDDIAEWAQVEREVRMTELAKHSANQLVPNTGDHYQINRLLDEWEALA